MLNKLFLISLTFILFGCSQTQQKPNLDEFSLKVIIEHISNRDTWKVTFQTSRPTSTLVFN
ncbi:MAG: hypothetical protein Q7U04_17605, partial [Bacteriovorax sp.]|nr:hypothetical protein [Bacteriovorax sp.]